MIIKRCQRTRYAMIGHDRVLISDAEVELYPILDLKTAKHDTHARKELVSCRRACHSSIVCR